MKYSLVFLASAAISLVWNTPSLALDNVVRYITTAELATITYDGDISDWEAVLGEPSVVHGDFKTCCSEDGTPNNVVPDVADQEILGVWVAWNDQTEMIYVAARVKDDFFAQNTDPLELGNIWIADDIEIFVDGDHSGGEDYDWPNGQASAQHSTLNQQTELVMSGLGSVPNAQFAAGRTSGASEIYEYELALPVWDDVHFLADGNEFIGNRTDFIRNRIIGLAVAFWDWEFSDAPENMVKHQYSTLARKANGKATSQAFFNADVFRHFVLEYPDLNVTQAFSGTEINIQHQDLDNETVATFNGTGPSGNITLTSSASGPALPLGWMRADPPVIFDLSAVETYTSMQVCFTYDENSSIKDENALELFHYDGGWAQLSAGPDVANNKVCGNPPSLSPFALLQPNSPPTVENTVVVGPAFLTRGGPAIYDVDALNIFGDVDGQLLAYSATTSNSAVATGSISGALLTIAPGETAGSATITLTADDGHGGVTDHDIAIEVLDATTTDERIIPHISASDLAGVTIDGDLSEWTGYAPTLTSPEHFDGSIGGSTSFEEVPEADQDITVWMRWSKQDNKIYIAAEIKDDLYGTNTDPGNYNIEWRSDDLEVYIDADNSGGDYDNANTHAQQYTINPNQTGTDQAVLFPHVLFPPPSTESAAAIVPGSPNTYTYELAIPGWDALDDQGSGTRHTFESQEVIGISLAAADIESDADADAYNLDHFSTLYGVLRLYKDTNVFADFILGFAEITTETNSSAGEDEVTLADPETGAAAAVVEFDTPPVGSFTTTLETSNTGPAVPSGFKAGGESTVYYDLSTTASFDSLVVTFAYEESAVGDETNLRLWHYADPNWEDVTTFHDPVANTIEGVVTSLSEFTFVEPDGSAPVVSIPHVQSLYDVRVEVPIDISYVTGQGIISAELFITYDGDLLTLPSIETSGTLAESEGWAVEANFVEGVGTNIDTAKVALANDEALAADGPLFRLGFTTADLRDPAATLLDFAHALVNDGTPALTALNGSLMLIGTDGIIISSVVSGASNAGIIPRETAAVIVTDIDENELIGVAEVINATVTNGPQQETVVLTETDLSNGIFSGQIATEFSLDVSPSSGDGVVQAKAGDQLSFCYDDRLDGSGQTQQRCDQLAVIGGANGQLLITAVSQPGDKLYVRVTDADLNADPVVQESHIVTAQTASGELEDVTLTELDADDDIFFGSIVTNATQPPVTLDGEVSTAKGDLVEIVYDDVLTAQGGTATLSVDHAVVNPFGDADGNGSVQAFDAAKVLLHSLVPFIAGIDSLSANVDELAPFGLIDPFDASLILQRRVGLIAKFPVQQPTAANHPQPETAANPKPAVVERRLALRSEDHYVALWAEDRAGILSGSIELHGLQGRVELAPGLEEQFLVASQPTETGLHAVFAGPAAVKGPGELLRLYPESTSEMAAIERAQLNGGRLLARYDGALVSVKLPRAFALYANVPNPFNPETAIKFALPQAARVQLDIYDLLGQKVRSLVSEDLHAGVHTSMWDGRNGAGFSVGSGVYYYRISAVHGDGVFTSYRKMVLLK